MTETTQRRNLLVCFCLTAAIVAVYWPVFHFGFIGFDDDRYVTGNPRTQGGLTLQNLIWALTTRETANWHPLTWVSLMLDHQLFGTWAGGYHLVNVLLHVANTLLLFAVLDRMTTAPWQSACVAALFALHPLHVESVAWVAERKDVLSTFFWMLTVWAYVRYVETFNAQRSSLHASVSAEALAKAERSTLHVFYCLALLFFALGLMAKPMLVTLPFVLLLLDYWPLGRTRWAKTAIGERTERPMSHLVREKLPFVALSAASCGVTYWAQHGGGAVVPLASLPLGTRIANALLAYVGYVGKMFWPVRLAVFYPLHPTLPAVAAIGAASGLLGATALVIWKAQHKPWLATGWFWYLGTLVPVIGLVQVGGQSMADRYTYVPLVGLFMMLCWSLPCSGIERRILRATTCVGAGAVLVVCAVLSRIQVGYWKSTETLFRHALNVTRDNWLAHNNLGGALGQTGHVEDAIAHLEQALRIKPDYAEAHHNLGNILLQTGRLDDATGHYEQALRVNPDYAEAHNNLGAALWQAGRVQEAVEHLEQALRLKPDYAEAHNNLGGALAGLGRVKEAMGHWEKALWIKPDYVQAHYNLGVALAQAGRVQEAIAHYEQALRLKPDYAEAHNDLGNALLQAGKLEDAMAHYERALRLKPDYAEAHNNLGNALLRAGKPEDAMAHYKQALQLKPGFAEAHYNLGVALGQVGKLEDAIGHYQQALRIKPDYAEAHNSLGAALVRLGRVQEAIGHWEQALKMKPDDAKVHNDLGAALMQVGKFEDAIGHFEQALQIKPDFAEVHNNFGAALIRRGRVHDAIGHFEQALRLKPDYADAHYNLGVTLEQAGKIAAAIGHYEQALRVKPDYTEAQNRLARLRAAQ